MNSLPFYLPLGFLGIVGVMMVVWYQAMSRLELRTLTLLHTIRIAVELVLYGLYLHRWVPKLMTFEGGNLDILSGLSAPVVYYFAFVRGRMNSRWLLVWNFICLGLLLNVVVKAMLSAPGDLQRLAFDQPNIAIQRFPFLLLPGFVVPVVLFAHVVTIRRLVGAPRLLAGKLPANAA